MDNEFNKLENAIFRWFKLKYPGSVLSMQLGSAQFSEREWTKVGYYIHFYVDKTMSKLDLEIPIDGAKIQSKEIESNGGSLLWAKDGYIECLELFSYGDCFGKEVSDFEIC